MGGTWNDRRFGWLEMVGVVENSSLVPVLVRFYQRVSREKLLKTVVHGFPFSPAQFSWGATKGWLSSSGIWFGLIYDWFMGPLTIYYLTHSAWPVSLKERI